MVELSRRVFVDKPTLIREKIQKTRLYISKHGYLKMLCSRCGKLFFCSGRCIFKLPENDIYCSENILGNTCLCEICDAARGFDLMHYKECEKDDQIKMVMKVMAKEKKD